MELKGLREKPLLRGAHSGQVSPSLWLLAVIWGRPGEAGREKDGGVPGQGLLVTEGLLAPQPPAYLSPVAPPQLPSLGLARMSPAPPLSQAHSLCSPKALSLCSLWH